MYRVPTDGPTGNKVRQTEVRVRRGAGGVTSIEDMVHIEIYIKAPSSVKKIIRS